MANNKKNKPGARPVDKQELAFDPIEAALRQLHDHVISEDIPDDFLKLLDQLGSDEGKPGGGG